MNLLDLFEGALENAQQNNLTFDTDANLEDYFRDYSEFAKFDVEKQQYENVNLSDKAIGIMIVAFRAEEHGVITSQNDRFYIYERAMQEIDL